MQLDQLIPKYRVCAKERVFQQKLLEQARLIIRMHDCYPVMVRLASSE